MKRVIIAALLTLSLVALSSSQASAASYTLEPISAEQSNAFKNKPTVVFRIGKDTKADADEIVKIFGRGNSNSLIFNYGSRMVFIPLKNAVPVDNFGGGHALSLFSKFTDNPLIDDPTVFTTPQILTGHAGGGGMYICDKITLKNTVAKEECSEDSGFMATLEFTTHIVDVSGLEKKIAEINNKTAGVDTTEQDRVAIAKLIERAEAVLDNHNSIQAEIDAAVAELEKGIANPTATVEEIEKKAEEDHKKAEEEKKKREESTNQAEDNKTQQTPQEVAPQSTKTSTKDASTSDLKSPNTGFNQSNSPLALISIFATIILGATIYGLKK